MPFGGLHHLQTISCLPSDLRVFLLEYFDYLSRYFWSPAYVQYVLFRQVLIAILSQNTHYFIDKSVCCAREAMN